MPVVSAQKNLSNGTLIGILINGTNGTKGIRGSTIPVVSGGAGGTSEARSSAAAGTPRGFVAVLGADGEDCFRKVAKASTSRRGRGTGRFALFLR